jgi:hypothetical protein
MVQERYREFIDRGETSPSALINALDEAMAKYSVVANVGVMHSTHKSVVSSRQRFFCKQSC